MCGRRPSLYYRPELRAAAAEYELADAAERERFCACVHAISAAAASEAAAAGDQQSRKGLPSASRSLFVSPTGE
jgi:hypothetical protein